MSSSTKFHRKDCSIFSGISLLIFLLLTSCSGVKPVSECNLSHLYSLNPPLRAEFSTAASAEDLLVFCKLDFPYRETSAAQAAFWLKYRIEYQVRPGFESTRCLLKDSLGPENFLTGPDQKPVFRILIPEMEKRKDAVFVLKVCLRNSAEEYLFPWRLPEPGNPDLSPFALFRGNGKTPVTGRMARSGDTLCIRSMDFRKTQVKVDFSPFSQMVALPPMATIPRPDTLPEQIYPLSIQLDERLVFREAGYYRVSDPQSGAGFGFLVGKNEFPQLSTAQELIEPMIYISTRDERNLLLQSANSKLALDQFWLKISPQKDRARELIKKYFLQIEQSNRSFSILKEGWKTDMGMVMAIFGPPVQVFRSRDTEIWIYDKNQSPESTLFYFFRQDAGNFGDIWELKRLSDYDKIWYGVVDLWRKGLIDR